MSDKDSVKSAESPEDITTGSAQTPQKSTFYEQYQNIIG